MGFQLAAIAWAKEQGVEPPEFEDHTPYSNKAMEDLLDIDEVIYAVNTVVIPHSKIELSRDGHPWCCLEQR